jgi:hypothetical protein
MPKVYPEPPEGYMYIFVKYVTLKDGRKIFASQYGKRAFRILVKE